MNSKEYEYYQYLKHWKKEKDLIKLKKLRNSFSDTFKHSFDLTKELYKQMPKRKDGEDSFIHPLNVVLALKEANITDEKVIIAGLLHDYIEENVDLQGKKSIKELNKFGEKTSQFLIIQLNKTLNNESKAKNIVKVVELLTRSKGEHYYTSIAKVFNYKDKNIQDIAIQIKLADRIHNILCLETFDERERIYQCFKNLFILNNIKKILIDRFGQDCFSKNPTTNPTVILFKRCAKATYDAFINICRICADKGMFEIKSMLQLAFKKYALQRAGLWEITCLNHGQLHLMNLYEGIILKYDSILHRELDYFKSIQKKEFNYCKEFFKAYNYDDKIIQAIIDYKDSYSLKEIIAYLLYLPDYILTGFLIPYLNKKGRIKNIKH